MIYIMRAPRNRLRKAIALLAAALTAVSLSAGYTALAGAGGKPLREEFISGDEGESVDFVNQLEQPYYRTVREEYTAKGYTPAEAEDIVLPPSHLSETLTEQLGETAFHWTGEDEEVSWTFTIEQAGLYEIRLDYLVAEGGVNPARRSITVDGETPFFECSGLYFYRLWEDDGEPIVNSLGDEIKPRQKEVRRWQSVSLEDGHGFYAEPFAFYFTPGEHTLTMAYVEEDMYIGDLTVTPQRVIPPYSEVAAEYEAKGYQPAAAADGGIFQAELTAVEKSDQTLRRESDTDPATQPSSPSERRLNMMGGVGWAKGNQTITWSFEVKQDGLYTLSLRYGQIWLNGLPSYRRIAIDGEVPFAELLDYRFDYGSGWQAETLSDSEGNPFQFYLTAGKHTLSMTVKFGEITEVVQSLNEDSIRMSNIMLDLLRITGNDPDPNYDYEFFTAIPGLEDTLRQLSASLDEKYQQLVDICGGDVPGFANSLKATRIQIDELIEDPFLIARRMDDLTTIQSNLGSWYMEFQTQPIMIDYFEVGSADTPFVMRKSNILEKIQYMMISLAVSFVKDYDSVGSVADNSAVITDNITVWIARGNEWASLIKELADQQFTPATGINVNINIMPASQLNAGAVNALMLSITSGKAPDAAMGVDPGSPVEFAIRDAVVDLSSLPGFDETVAPRFIEQCLVPFTYRGGIYALPETMDFRVLIYRKDIVAKLGLTLPDTRQDLYDTVLPALYQNGMNFYYPRDDSQFVYQHGAAFYTEDGLRSGLDTPEAYQAFKESTELYTNYGIPVTANFYNRFRSGEMPMGIGSFTDYIQISVAAPELSGKWGIAPLPGIEREDGSVDRSVGSITGQCSLIMSQTDKVDAAWQFLQWWTEAQTQTDFGREIEALLGSSARWNSANVEAFCNMPWPQEDLAVIQEMWPFYREVPVVLGGYFTGRHLNNAWNNVVIGGEPLRDSLEEAVKEINRELSMKQREYGVT